MLLHQIVCDVNLPLIGVIALDRWSHHVVMIAGRWRAKTATNEMREHKQRNQHHIKVLYFVSYRGLPVSGLSFFATEELPWKLR
jgi:hypothetical protein